MAEARIGFFGMNGHQIHKAIPTLTRTRLVEVGGAPGERVAQLKEQFPDLRVFDDFDSMLTQGEADLISFCYVPRADQCALVIRALKAGKHCLVEKPMACNQADFDALRETAASVKVQLRTMTPMPYHPDFNGMKKVIDDGIIGEVVQVYALKSYPYNDARPQDRRVDGGIIMQAGIHAVSFIRHVTGMEFTEVLAQDTGTGNPRDGALQMAGVSIYRMTNGGLATVLCNYCNPRTIGFHGNDQLRVHGAKGMIELVDGRKRRMLVTLDEGPREFPDVPPEKPYPQDLIDCILDGTPTTLSQADSFANTLAVLRAQQSAECGEKLAI